MQKTAVAVAHCKQGNGAIKLNGRQELRQQYQQPQSGAAKLIICSGFASSSDASHQNRQSENWVQPSSAPVGIIFCSSRHFCSLFPVTGTPLELVQPDILRYKAFEPVLLLGRNRLKNLDIRIRVKGGGHVSQIYAIRQALAKAVIAFYQKCKFCNCHSSSEKCHADDLAFLLYLMVAVVDEQSKQQIKEVLLTYDRTLLVADPRRCEPKKCVSM